MDVAVDNGVAGIIAQCGGGCTCCTCHIWVLEEWQDQLKPAHPDEDDLLAYALGRSSRSRLACQVRLTKNLDGITAEIPSES